MGGQVVMKIAVVHDMLIDMGGGGRLMVALAKAFNADIWTTQYIADATYPELKQFKVFSHSLKSFHIPPALKTYLKIPRTGLIETEAIFKFRNMDLSAYDLIITSGPCGRHIAVQDKNHPCIYYEPGVEEYHHLKGLSRIWVWYMMKLNDEAMRKIDVLTANSEFTREKIQKYYHRDAEVIYAPVNIQDFHSGDSEDYFLSVQRIAPDKKIETQLAAFRLSPQQRLLIAGSIHKGNMSYFQKLNETAPPNVTFRLSVSNQELSDLYARSKAVIQTNPDEAFGHVPVEAMASGKPCIAVNSGGLKETIVHGKTGILVDAPYPENLARAVKDFNSLDFNPDACMERAKLFSEEMFIERMRKIVSKI
jgi:glycosyltransferase involved in cell wall biosynthesis